MSDEVIQYYSPANVLFQWLCLKELAGDPALDSDQTKWPAYVNTRPKNPDNLVVVTDTSGTLDGRAMDTGETYEHPGIQLQVRGGTRYEQEAYNLMRRISKELDTLKNFELSKEGNTVYTLHSVTKTTNITPLGREPDTNRPSFVLNLIVSYTEGG